MKTEPPKGGFSFGTVPAMLRGMKTILFALAACMLAGCATNAPSSPTRTQGDPSSFAALVEMVYQAEWDKPSTPAYLSPARNVVIISIVVSSGGEVLSYEVLADSRSDALNQSVIEAVQKVAFIAPPPGGQRRFTVMFDQEGWKVTARI